MNYLLVSILILRISIICAEKTNLPVLLIDTDNVLKDINVVANPFAKMSSAQFADILFESKKNSETVVIFVEDKLSTEDLSTKDRFGTPYKHIHEAMKANQVKYFPGVADPYNVLYHFFEPVIYNVFYWSPGINFQIVDKKPKHIYVYFHEGMNSTRAQSLRQHDSVMMEVIALLKKLKPGPIVAFYTGKINPVVVKKIKYVLVKELDESQDLSVLVITERAMFRFIGVYAATPTRRASFDQVPVVGKEKWTAKRLSTKMAYTDFELEFHFGFDEKEWKLDSVALLEGGEEVGRTRMFVSVPWGFSYLCGEPLVIVNRRDNSFVSVSQYQLQPRSRRRRIATGFRHGPDHEESDPEAEPEPGGGAETAPGAGGPAPEPGSDPGAGGPAPEPGSDPGVGVDAGTDPLLTPELEASPPTGECFDTAINCGPYFNTNILATLFITIICLSIAMSGIIMMMSCNSNNRYDDPQGKTIVIASEAVVS